MARLGEAFVGISPNLTGFGSQLRGKLAAALKGIPAEIKVTADTTPALGDIAAMRRQAAALLAKSVELRATVDTKTALAQLLSLQATFAAIGKSLDRSSLGDAALLRLQARLLGAESSLDSVARSASRAATPIGLLAGSAGLAYGRFGILRTRVNLFAGALTAVGVPAILATAGGLHILADAAIEVAAVIVPAGVAFGVFAAAAVPTVQAITKQMQALNTTSTALGQQIFPLTGGFSAMADAVQPKVYQLFGEALVVAQHDTGLLTTIAVQAGTALDQLGARAAVALTSGGLASFLKQGPADLAKIGDIIGNIFGSIGNLLRVIPGYANVLLSALDGLTKGLEAVTGSPVGQWLAGVALAFHGFLLWGGLAATAAVFLGNALVGLAAKFGIGTAGALAFDAAQFGTGIKQMLAALPLLSAEMVGLGVAEDGTAIETGILAGAMTALDAVNPLVWVGLAAAALGGLVFWLTRSTSGVDALGKAVQASLGNQPVSSLGANILASQTAAQQRLTAATRDYNAAAAPYAAMIAAGGRAGQAAGEALHGYAAAVNGARADVAQSVGDYANYNAVLKVAHGNVSFLNDAGITSTQILAANASQLKQYELEVQAAADAQNALGLGTGRAAAAQNAQTNTWLTDTIPAMQKVITAEDQLLTVITGGQVAFNNFEQSIQGTTAKFVSPSGLADAAKLAKGNLSGINEQSLAFSNTLYTQAIPSLQKTIGALELQSISTGDLTKVVATGSGEILNYTGNNKEARSVMVDLINNALGPGTVSLQSLNTWVKQNSTTLAGFSTIVAQSTIKAGTLASVLQQDAVKAFQDAAFATSGAAAAITKYTGDLQHNQSQTAQGKSDRSQLIKDLENAGFSAKDAKKFVDNMQTSINALHGKNVPITATFQTVGNGNVSVSGTGLNTTTLFVKTGQIQKIGGHTAAGALVTQGTTPTADDVLAMVSKGETIVSAADSKKLAGTFRAMGVPGYAAGGAVGDPYAPFPPFILGKAGPWFGNELASGVESFIAADIKTLRASAANAAAQAAAGAFGVSGAGPVGGDAAANKALARATFPWAASQWAPFDLLEMHEAGYNRFARNPTSGAYGIPQAYPPTKMPFAAQAAGGSHAGPQLSWMYSYIRSVYGNPENAWAQYFQHPGGVGSYAKGGLVKPTLLSIRSAIAAAQKGERAKYFGLENAFATGPAKYRTHTVRNELATLAAEQKREVAGYKAIAGTGLTTATLEHLGALARAEQRTTLDKALNKSFPAGHPGWATDLRKYLGTISALSESNLPATVKGKGSSTGKTGSGAACSCPLPLAPLGPSHTALGGVLTFDRGGWLPKGLSLAYNGTGRPEPVGSGGGQTIVLELHVHGPVGSQAELEDWFVQTANRTARTGKLTQAVHRAQRK